MGITVHVLTGSGRLAAHEATIERVAAEAVQRISERLPPAGVDVVFQDFPAAAIPGLAMGGYAPTGHLVQVSLDPAAGGFKEKLERHLPRVLAHELHHCVRWQGPGYGVSLGEALVSEGLADHFDLEVYPGSEPYEWTQALDERGLQEVWELARPALWDADYDHALWFFNTGDDGPPFHAGYALGFHLVRLYLRANPERRPSDLVSVPARQIVQDGDVLVLQSVAGS